MTGENQINYTDEVNIELLTLGPLLTSYKEGEFGGLTQNNYQLLKVVDLLIKHFTLQTVELWTNSGPTVTYQ